MRIVKGFMAAAILTLICAPAFAQDDNPTSTLPFGVRAGYTKWDSLSQMHVGAHFLMGEIFPNVEFTPNIEVGFGDSTSLITLNGDVTYQFTELVEKPWGFYAGGSLAFVYVNPDNAGSDTDLGLSGLIGGKYLLDSGNEAMLEVRFGILDNPDLKITVGYTLF